MSGSDLYTGTLDVIVLKALSGGPMHGYAVGLWIRKNSQDVLGVREGVLYPALHRLERKRLVGSRWGESEEAWRQALDAFGDPEVVVRETKEALACTRVLSGLLHGVGTLDPVVFSLVPAVLLGVGQVASYLPARYASRCDPVVGLRAE